MTLLEIHEPGETPLPHAGEGSLAVGIDLGTTNSVVAIAREGKPAALHDETGKALVPSVVAYPDAECERYDQIPGDNPGSSPSIRAGGSSRPGDGYPTATGVKSNS